MKTTLIIPDQIFRELKRKAAQRRATLSEVVAEVLRRGLDERAARVELAPLPTHRMGRPKIDLSDRNALYDAMEGK